MSESTHQPHHTNPGYQPEEGHGANPGYQPNEQGDVPNYQPHEHKHDADRVEAADDVVEETLEAGEEEQA